MAKPLKDRGVKFSKENQPSPEAKSNGKKKAILLKEFAKQIVSGKLKENVQDIADLLDINIELVTVEMALHMAQLNKAILTGDTVAYNSVVNRILGKVKEVIEVESKDKTWVINPIIKKSED